MKLEFSLDLKKTILLGICFLFLSIALVSAGYLFGLSAGKEYARLKASTSQKELKTGEPNNAVSQKVTVSEQAGLQPAPATSAQTDAPQAGPDAAQGPGAVPGDQARPEEPTAPEPPKAAALDETAPSGDTAPPAGDAAGDTVKTEPPAEPQAPPASSDAQTAAAPSSTPKDQGEDKPVPPPAPEPQPSASEEPPAQTWPAQYTVQVGSFSVEKNAMELIDRLKKMNYPTYMYLYTDSKGRLWYVVQVGDFSTKKEASAKAAEIQKQDLITLVKPITESIRQKRQSFQ